MKKIDSELIQYIHDRQYKLMYDEIDEERIAWFLSYDMFFLTFCMLGEDRSVGVATIATDMIRVPVLALEGGAFFFNSYSSPNTLKQIQRLKAISILDESEQARTKGVLSKLNLVKSCITTKEAIAYIRTNNH